MSKTTAPKRINEAFANAIKVSERIQEQIDLIEKEKRKQLKHIAKK